MKRILIADDDADDRALFQNAYQNRNDIILLPLVVNGVEVIDKLSALDNNEDLPDLIILDHNMPLMNGRQTLAFIKSNARYMKIPVCICSTYADNKLVTECIKLGAYKVASKPITQTEYDHMLNDFLTAFGER